MTETRKFYSDIVNSDELSPGARSLIKTTNELASKEELPPFSDIILVTVMPDDSYSMKYAGNIQAVIDGHNGVIRALEKARREDRDSILFRTQYLNGFVLNDWTRLRLAKHMDNTNYDPDGITPLYDNTVALLASIMAKKPEDDTDGTEVRSGTLIITDAADIGSKKCTADDVRKIVESMLLEKMHIVSFMGISDGETDFRAVAKSMGIQEKWILTPDNDGQSIRRAFNTFSNAMGQASQTARAFDQRIGGGFVKFE